MTIARPYFDQICSGAKTTEYRVDSTRISNLRLAPFVKFINGYSASSPYCICELLSSGPTAREEVAQAHPEAMHLFSAGCTIIALRLGRVLEVHDPKKQREPCLGLVHFDSVLVFD